MAANPTPEIAEDLATPAMWEAAWEASQDYFVGDAVTKEGFRRGLAAMLSARPTPPKVAGDVEEIAGRLEANADIMAESIRLGAQLIAGTKSEALLREAAAHLRATASLAVEIEALQRAHVDDMARLERELCEHHAAALEASEAARLAAERKLEAAVGVLASLVPEIPRVAERDTYADDYIVAINVYVGELRAARTFLAAMNTEADDAEK